MCNLCDSNSTTEREHIREFANDLRRIAAFYDQVANGNIKPHTDEYGKIKTMAVHVLKELFGEWI